MILTSDYHTHTVFSHGKGTIEENVNAAIEKGLKEIAISDHGFSHPFFGISKRKVPKMRKEIDRLNGESDGKIKVLLGIESNITGTDGSTDLKEKYYDEFDVFMAGLHKLIMYKFGSFFSLGLPDLAAATLHKKDVSESLRRRNTKTFINVIKNNPVDVITHLNFGCYADVKEVAKAAADYGTYLELNAKKVHMSDEELYEVLKTDVKFVIGSDAHTPDRVGEISLVEKMIKRLDFHTDRIMNVDGRLPEFRFKKFKDKL